MILQSAKVYIGIKVVIKAELLIYLCVLIRCRHVTDLVLSALRLLREDIREVVDSMEPVEL